MPFLDFEGLRRFKEKLDIKFGNPIDALMSWKPSNNGSSGQVLRSNGDGTTSWQVAVTEEEVSNAVDVWMDNNIAPNTAITLDSSLTATNAAAQAAAAGNMIMVADAQPSAETNKVWIKKTPDDEVMVPTVSDLNTAIAGVHGVPAGGSPNQVLAKRTGTDYDLRWVDQAGGDGTFNRLQWDNIPDTTQSIVFDQQGNIASITHTDSGSVAVRTDAFTFGENTITEVRTLNTGESLTLVTNLTTLVTTVTYAA